MPKLLIGLGLVVVILSIYTLVECALFDRGRIRGLPRSIWIVVIILVPVIGPLLWIFVGRGSRSVANGRAVRAVAPDDDPDFLNGLNREKNQEERIRQLEQELADLDKPDPRASGKAGQGGATGVDPKKTDPSEGEPPGRRDA